LNTQSNWFLGDWNSGSPITVPAPNAKGQAVELFSVLLHEAGNALGVADNNLRNTVMFTDYTTPKGRLTASDITAIRNIYGARRDIYETVANNSRATATRIVHPVGYNGQTPLSVRGSLNTMSDVDFYRFRPLAGRDRVNVRLWASGISLVKAKMEVLDSTGVKIGDVKTDSIFENNLQLEVGLLDPTRDYFIRVARNTTDVFGIGDYRIDLDYRDPSLQPSIVPPVWDADAVDEDNQIVDYVSVDQLFSNRLVSTETNANNTLARATRLETTPGFLRNTRFEAQASLSSGTDRDFYRFAAPTTVAGVLNIDVNPVGNLSPHMDVVVMNGAGDRVPARLLKKAGDGRSLQILNPVAGAEYVIGVQSLATSATRTGNYIVTVDFATEAASMKTVFGGSVTSSQSDFSQIETAKSQLFRFDLSAAAATNREGVQLSIFNERTLDLVFSLSVGAGLTTTEYIWLPKGAYLLQADSRTRQSQIAGTILFQLRADVISDDQGPSPVDPTILTPPPVSPPWIWTDYPPQKPPVVSPPPPVMEDPWLEEQNLNLFRDYYSVYYG
jgi:Matrixin